MSTSHPRFTARIEDSPETMTLRSTSPFITPMLLKQGPFAANTDVHIRYTFEPVERATCVIRALDLTIQIPGLLKVAEPLVAWAFRKENARILAELKRYVEALLES